MTVAAIIEIGAGGHSEPGRSSPGANAVGKAHSAEWNGALGVSAYSTSVTAAASFRSSWQSMLASLDAGLETSVKDNAATGEKLDAADGFSRMTAGSDGAAIELNPVSTPQRSGLVSAQIISSPVESKYLLPTRTGSGIPNSQTTSATPRQSTSILTTKSGAAVRTPLKKESGGGLHSAGALKSAKTAVSLSAAGPLTANVAANIATAQNIPAVIPSPAAEVEPTSIAEAPTQISLTDLTGELSSVFTPGSVPLASSPSNTPAILMQSAIGALNQTAGALDGTGTAGISHSDHPSEAVSETGDAVHQAVQEKPSAAHAKTSQAAVHGSAQNRMVEETKTISTNGLVEAVGEKEPSFTGRIQPRVEGSSHSPANGQPRLQEQTAIENVEAVTVPVGMAAANQNSSISIAAGSQSVSAPELDSMAGKSVSAGSSKSNPFEAGQRSSRAVTVVHGDRPVRAVAAVQDGLNNTAMARDLSESRVAINPGEESAGAVSGNRSTARETFAALDSEVSTGTTTWVHAGTRSAEAGFEDPALGWIGVRADANGGGVHASLVPGSADAAVTLGGHLGGLNSYLNEQHTPVDSLTLAATEERPAHSGTGHGSQQNMHQDMHQGARQDSGQGSAASGQQPDTQISAPQMTAPSGREVPSDTGRTEPATQPYSAYSSRGMHISVMA